MALTMTRTRTQATLTKLAGMVANVHGELAFLDELVTADGRVAGEGQARSLPPELHARLEARRLQLVRDRGALYATIRQFDALIDPAGICSGDGWRLRLGSRRLGAKTLLARYFSRK